MAHPNSLSNAHPSDLYHPQHYDPRYYATPFSAQSHAIPGLHGYFPHVGTHGGSQYPQTSNGPAAAGPSSFSGTLGDITSTTVNTVTDPQATVETVTRKGKRKNGSTTAVSQKRARTSRTTATTMQISNASPPIPEPEASSVSPGPGPTSSTPQPSIPGVGPASTPSAEESRLFKSVVDIPKEVTKTGATDVWYFVHGLKDSVKPIATPVFTDPLTKKRPSMQKYQALLCSLCP